MPRAARLFFGTALIIGGVIHWFIIFGYLEDKVPSVLTFYFHSLAIFDVIAGLGILLQHRFAYIIGLFIALTQIAAHAYLMYIDMFLNFGSGVSYLEREGEILFAFVFGFFCVRALLGYSSPQNTH